MARSSSKIPGKRAATPRVARVGAQLAKLVRRRRSPELAREEILAAASRVFSESQPDAVGLKDVARAAGVSHALITHYFGTYSGLIDAVLEQRLRALREELLAKLRDAGPLARPGELLARLFHTLEDPVHLRLLRWSLASERPMSGDAFLLRDRGLRLVARQIIASTKPDASPAIVEQLELALLTAVSAAFGYALGKPALVGSLGREPTRALDTQVLDTLGAMLHAHLRMLLGIPALPQA